MIEQLNFLPDRQLDKLADAISRLKSARRKGVEAQQASARKARIDQLEAVLGIRRCQHLSRQQLTGICLSCGHKPGDDEDQSYLTQLENALPRASW